MIILKSLRLKDFYSHENTKIDFKDNVKLLLDGESGAGKSTILESIIFALYGESRTDSKSIVRSGCKKAIITLELVDSELGGASTVTTIERSMTSAGKHALEVLFDGVASPITGIKDLQNWIEKDLIGASYLLFVNSVAYMQGNAESFVAQTAAKRKDLLLEIVKAENYDEYYEKAKETLNTINLQKTALEMQVLSLKAEIAIAENLINGEGELNVALLSVKMAIDSLEAKKEELLKLIAKFDESDKNIKLCEDRVVGANRDLSRSKMTLESLRTQLKELEGLTLDSGVYGALEAKIGSNSVVLSGLESMLGTQMDSEKAYNAYLLTRPYITDKSSSISEYAALIEKEKSKMGCPSGDLCPHQNSSIETITLYEGKIGEMNKLMVKEALDLSTWEIGLASLETPIDTKALLSKVMESRIQMSADLQVLSDMDKIRAKIESLSAQQSLLPSLEKDLFDKTVFRDVTIGELAVMNEQRNSGDTAKQKSELSTIASELIFKRGEESSINSELILVKKCKEELVGKQAVLSNISTTLLPELTRNFDDVSLVKEAFGSKGVKSVMIDYILPKLEDKINSVLSQLSDFTVRLDTQQLKADGEGNKEGLFITLTNELGQEMPFENYSGGEKLKITVAISEALASLQKVGFRLMDEAFIGLDENSTESFSLVLERLQDNFSQVLMISHLREIKEMFEDKITIIKRNGVSTA